MALGKRNATKIAKMYIASMIFHTDGFDSSNLSQEENELVQNECMKICEKLHDGTKHSERESIVEEVLKL